MTNAIHATAFAGHSCLTSGTLQEVAFFLADLSGPTDPVLVFDDATGKVVDLDLRGTREEIAARLQPSAADADGPRRAGRPRLGVVAREVTLLPKHWDWLARQRGGASATLRRLVDAASKAGTADDERRAAEERTYNFIVAIAGDLPAFEEATRALFAHDVEKFAEQIAGWPEDVRSQAMRLLLR